MLKTGKEIASEGIISGFLEKNIQQQGIDLRLKNIKMVSTEYESCGCIPAEGKTTLPITREVVFGRDRFILSPGYYEVEFEEGCKIPKNCCMKPMTRSSVIRCGGEIRSGVFDAGFETEHIGSYLKVEVPMYVEIGARLAQALVMESNDVENLYNGQFQNDKQRK